MNAIELLPALKIDLGISADVYNPRLISRIETAMQRIEREGCTLTDSESDRDLVLMYAAWLWRERVSGAEMPRMLARQTGREGEALADWIRRFCKRKWNSDFSREMSRSCNEMIRAWRKEKE